MDLEKYLRPILEHSMDQIVEQTMKDPVVFGVAVKGGNEKRMRRAIYLIMRKVCGDQVFDAEIPYDG